MKYLYFFVILILPASLFAVFPYSTAETEKAVNRIEAVSASIISDSFSPFSGYSQGDGVVSVSPAYFIIDQVSDDPEIKGDNLSGKAMGLGGAYALTDEIMIYAVAAGMNISGNAKLKVFGDSYPVLDNKIEYSLFSLHCGAGYQLFNTGMISMPVFGGLHTQYYNASVKTEEITYYDVVDYTVNAEVEGSGLLFGLSGGAALSLRIKKFFITPYFLYIYNFNSTDLDAEVKARQTTFPYAEYTLKDKAGIERVSAGMAGLNIGFTGEKGFSFSLSMGSMLSSLAGHGGTPSEDGLEMKSVVLICSYSI